ncbi:hypothetical protein SK571_39305 [Lentzea sp. BCCO 10_0798]|uniref:Uncharacterized protein n=1 Tax=Lentzea kristufekii TaxID=3095430 RepID=A0ABU4U4G6_9PSEU|nr:hypothetical protein [Lentzea sp. BCCO 10_0798]MDX8055459.1 hypothetical protein [Lentzea sp. BCCO 10_0798]
MQYLEPRTDVPAKDDWSTGLILQDLRWGARTLGGIAVVAGVGAVTCWLLPSTPGNISAFVVLALVTLVGGLGPLMYRSETKAERRGLLENAKVVRAEDAASSYPVRERVEWPLGRPLDDAATARAHRGMRWGVRAWCGPPCPRSPGECSSCSACSRSPRPGGLALVFGLLGIPKTSEISRWYRDAVTAVESSAQWTPVAITLFPWQPDQHVAGLAEMPGGLALVQFVLPDLNVVANIADTGVMWVAGTHGDVIAVGVPRVPVLTFAAVQPDRDTPKEDPIPPILRFHQPDFSGLPRWGAVVRAAGRRAARARRPASP